MQMFVAYFTFFYKTPKVTLLSLEDTVPEFLVLCLAAAFLFYPMQCEESQNLKIHCYIW